MILDSDCVRDVLMAVERCEFGETLTLEALCQQVGQHSKEEVWYTCLKLEEGGFLRLTLVPQMRQSLPGIKSIDDLTYQGHEFIAKIRDAQQWTAVKKGITAVRNYSLSAISSIAEGVTSAAISAYLKPDP